MELHFIAILTLYSCVNRLFVGVVWTGQSLTELNTEAESQENGYTSLPSIDRRDRPHTTIDALRRVRTAC
jgi:hypothetical protein